MRGLLRAGLLGVRLLGAVGAWFGSHPAHVRTRTFRQIPKFLDQDGRPANRPKSRELVRCPPTFTRGGGNGAEGSEDRERCAQRSGLREDRRFLPAQ
ncbi:hypothetical protein GCM10023074_45100 [Microbispora amethystogenes]